MTKAFVLITCDINKQNDIASQIRKCPGIRKAEAVFGAYDCVVETEEIKNEEIRNIINSNIRPLKHVQATLTLNITKN